MRVIYKLKQSRNPTFGIYSLRLNMIDYTGSRSRKMTGSVVQLDNWNQSLELFRALEPPRGSMIVGTPVEFLEVMDHFYPFLLVPFLLSSFVRQATIPGKKMISFSKPYFGLDCWPVWANILVLNPIIHVVSRALLTSSSRLSYSAVSGYQRCRDAKPCVF